MRARWLPLAAGVAGLLVFGAALAAVEPVASVVVRDAGGRVTSQPLPDSGEFGIQYMHSYYKVPAVEHFRVGPRGSFEMLGVSSPSEAVLDYYELEGRKEIVDGGWTRLVPKEAPRFEELPLVATEKGKRTLVVSGARTPLFAEGGEPAHLTLRVEEDALRTGARTKLTQASRQTILTP